MKLGPRPSLIKSQETRQEQNSCVFNNLQTHIASWGDSLDDNGARFLVGWCVFLSTIFESIEIDFVEAG